MKTLGYGIKQGFKNIVQNKIFSLVAIGTIAICLFLLGLFYALLSNFQHMMYNVESNVGLTVFFDSGIEPEEIDSLGEQIRKLDGVERWIIFLRQKHGKSFKKKCIREKKIWRIPLVMKIRCRIQRRLRLL